MSWNSNGKRKVLGQIKETNSSLSSRQTKRNSWGRSTSKTQLIKKNDETIEKKLEENDENEELLTLKWNDDNRDIVIDREKRKIIEIRDQLLSEKMRILLKESKHKALQTYFSDLTVVYDVVKKVFDPETNVTPDDVVSAMDQVRFPEDEEETRKEDIKVHIYDVLPPPEKSLPASILDLNTQDYNETMELYSSIENAKSSSQGEIEFDVPTEENLQSSFDDNTIHLFTNWLRLLSDEVEILQQKEESLDQALGELDTSISHISDLIRVGMLDMGLIYVE